MINYFSVGDVLFKLIDCASVPGHFTGCWQRIPGGNRVSLYKGRNKLRVLHVKIIYFTTGHKKACRGFTIT